MAGQRTKLRLGGLDVEISLVKVASEPSAARWQVWRENEAGEVVETPEPAEPVTIGGSNETVSAAESALGGPVPPLAPPNPDVTIMPHTPAQAKARDALAERKPEKVKVVRGVVRESGERVDLTAQLAAIDEHTRIEGMEVVAAIPAASVPRLRMRGASYVVPVDPTSRKALGLLYGALVERSASLAVRFTKRTNQALAILTPSKSAGGCLVLVEVEFAANIRQAPAQANVFPVEASKDEIGAALEYVEGRGGSPTLLDRIGDERRELHAQLLANARAGIVFKLPEKSEEESELAKLLTR